VSHTQAQNSIAERSEGVIIEKTHAIKITANLPHDLWNEIVNYAVYLQDHTLRESNRWKLPYKRFYTFLANRRLKKPQLVHLKAYGCKVYTMMLDAQLKKKRLNKLDLQAHIGYLVGYNSTNIYRIWILYKGIIIFTRDIIFDEKTFFDSKWTNITKDLYVELDMLIEKIQLSDI